MKTIFKMGNLLIEMLLPLILAIGLVLATVIGHALITDTGSSLKLSNLWLFVIFILIVFVTFFEIKLTANNKLIQIIDSFKPKPLLKQQTSLSSNLQSEQKIEKQIQDKGLNAPRLTPQHIDSVIIDETYTNLPDGRTVICQLTLKNGYTIDGKSACVSKENFDQEIGNEIARKNAREKIWELEGYLLKQEIYDKNSLT